jgi:Mn-dependent DtxR family transcriptional regulator
VSDWTPGWWTRVRGEPGDSDHKAVPADSLRAQEYLFMVRRLTDKGLRVTSGVLADRLGITPQASRLMLVRLREHGLVEPQDRTPRVRLASAGRHATDVLLQREAAIKWLLSTVVGLDDRDAERDATLLAFVISPSLQDRLIAMHEAASSPAKR